MTMQERVALHGHFTFTPFEGCQPKFTCFRKSLSSTPKRPLIFFAVLHIIRCKESKEFQPDIMEDMMEIAKISSKGQITIPVSVRNKLKLKAGDKVLIFEENGRFYFENSAMLAFKRAEEAFAGEAAKAGFETEEDMQDYMREIRKEIRGY